VATLTAPNSFGDLALIDYKPRTATIKCKSNCTFAVLDKANYQKIFGRLQKKTFERTIELFRSIPYFTFWSINDIKKFEQYFTEMKFQWNSIVYKQNEPSDFIYIIKDGEFEFTKKNNDIKDLSRGLFRCTSPVAGVNPLSNKMETRDLRLKVIGKGNIFGEIEAVSDKNFTTTVR
jgi:CRP-like cAMP-binding protein